MRVVARSLEGHEIETHRGLRSPERAQRLVTKLLARDDVARVEVLERVPDAAVPTYALKEVHRAS